MLAILFFAFLDVFAKEFQLFPVDLNPGMRVLVQHEEGPCPILAITNTLILRGDIRLDTVEDKVDSSWILNSTRAYLHHRLSLIELHSEIDIIHQTLKKLPELFKQINVDPYFTSTTSFKIEPFYFRAFNIPLRVYFLANIQHVWVLDPSDPAYESILSYGMSYEEITASTHFSNERSNSESSRHRKAVEGFLFKSEGLQATNYGLVRLSKTMKLESFGVVFQHNHFHVVFKDMEDSLVATIHTFVRPGQRSCKWVYFYTLFLSYQLY